MSAYYTTTRGRRILLGGPADAQGDGDMTRYLGIVDAMAGSGFPIVRLCYARWGPHDARHLTDLVPIVVDDPDDEYEMGRQ